MQWLIRLDRLSVREEPQQPPGRLIVVRNIIHPRLLLLKFGLFVFLGSIAAGGIVLQQLNLRTAFLLTVCIWAFARAYYFCFYVIERYIDPEFRFSGVFAAVRFAWSSARNGSELKNDRALP